MSVIKFPKQPQPPRPKPFEEIVLADPASIVREGQGRQDLFAGPSEAEQARAIASRSMEIGQSVSIVDPVNRSLMLAQRYKFLDLCRPLLWGAETETREELFGELLRSVVVTFLPVGLHDLLSLKAVVAAQWRLNRLLEIQGNLFQAHSASQEHDSRGLPRATAYALEMDDQIDQAQAAVANAINAYYLSRRLARREAS